jgi:hypothetical protein
VPPSIIRTTKFVTSTSIQRPVAGGPACGAGVLVGAGTGVDAAVGASSGSLVGVSAGGGGAVGGAAGLPPSGIDALGDASGSTVTPPRVEAPLEPHATSAM